MKIAICVPVYNDWTSVKALLSRIDEVASHIGAVLDVLLVDDGSTEPPLTTCENSSAGLGRVTVLRLRRNLGHQRAIAVGLTHLHVEHDYDGVAVMDADGEDRPEDLPLLIDRCRESQWTSVVFAQRAKRSEGFAFRIGYVAFKAVHSVLIGRNVDVGNFSVVPRSALERLVGVAEMWNHYAASVFHARLATDKVPIARGKRIAGQSKMNFVSLVTHGLSAISVYSDVVGARLLASVGIAMLILTGAIAAVLGIRFATDLAIPGWATNAFGALLVGLLNLCVLSMLMVLFTLRQRSEYAFIPLRDYKHFLLEERACSFVSHTSNTVVGNA